MSTRGSLRQMIMAAAQMLEAGHYEFVGIMCNPRAKYYTVMTPTEMEEKQPNDENSHIRLVFLGTKRELATFCKYEQIELFKEEVDVDSEEDIQDGEQQSS